MEIITGTVEQTKERKKWKDMTRNECRLYIISKRELFASNRVTPEELVEDTLPRLCAEVDEEAKAKLLEFYEIVIDRYQSGDKYHGGNHSHLDSLKEEDDDERKKEIKEAYKTRSTAQNTAAEMFEIMDLECTSSVKYLYSILSGRASRKARESGLTRKLAEARKKKFGDRIITAADFED